MSLKSGYVVLVLRMFFIGGIKAAQACGKTPIGAAAASLSPCLAAAVNLRVKVPPACCAKVNALIGAVLLSLLSKQAGIMPGIAISIPKRCNIRNRPSARNAGDTLFHIDDEDDDVMLI